MEEKIDRFAEIEQVAGTTVRGYSAGIQRLQEIARHLIEICREQQQEINQLQQEVRELRNRDISTNNEI